MANLFVNLALPALNGAGEATDVSAMGPAKTIVVAGLFEGAAITIEASTDDGTEFAPVATFQSGSTRKELQFAATHMRVNVSGRSALTAFSANIDVGANDLGAEFAVLTMPDSNGAGDAVDVSALGTFNTVIVSGSFPKAAVLIEASEDGDSWAPVCQFSGRGGIWTGNITGNFMRTKVKGRTGGSPFTNVTAAVAAANDPSAGGGGGGAVSRDESLVGDGSTESPLGVSTGGLATDTTDPLADVVPRIGAFQPTLGMGVSDDYMGTLGYSSIVKSAAHATHQFYGPGPQNDMVGVCRLRLDLAVANEFTSLTQFVTQGDSGNNLDIALFTEVWMATRISFESDPEPGTSQCYIGFSNQLDLGVDMNNREGAWFQMDEALGGNFFARYRLIDDSGLVVGTVNLGESPRASRRGNNLAVRIIGGPEGSANFYIEGVNVLSVPLVNPTGTLTNIVGLKAQANTSNSIHCDWLMMNAQGRPQ